MEADEAQRKSSSLTLPVPLGAACEEGQDSCHGPLFGKPLVCSEILGALSCFLGGHLDVGSTLYTGFSA